MHRKDNHVSMSDGEAHDILSKLVDFKEAEPFFDVLDEAQATVNLGTKKKSFITIMVSKEE